MPGPYDHFFNPALMGVAQEINKSTHTRSFTNRPSKSSHNPEAPPFIPSLTNANMVTGYSAWAGRELMSTPTYLSQDLPSIKTQAMDLVQVKAKGEDFGMRALDSWKEEAELRSKSLGGEKVKLSSLLAYLYAKWAIKSGISGNKFHLPPQSPTSQPTPTTEEEMAKEYQQQLKQAQIDLIAALSVQEIKRMQIFEQQESSEEQTSSDTIDGKVIRSQLNRGNPSASEMNSGIIVHEPDQLRLWDELADDPERHLKSFTVSALDYFMRAQTHPEFAPRLAGIIKTTPTELKDGEDYLEREGQVEHSEESGGVLLFYDPDVGTPKALWDTPSVPLPPVGSNLGQTRFFKYVWMLTNSPKSGLPEDDSNFRKEVLKIMSDTIKAEDDSKIWKEVPKIMSDANKENPADAAAWKKAEVWANDTSGWY